MADNEKPWIPGEENERTIPPVSVTAKAPTEAEKAEYEANLPWIPEGWEAKDVEGGTPSFESPALTTFLEGGVGMGGGDELAAGIAYTKARAAGASHEEASLAAARRLKADREQRRQYAAESPWKAGSLELAGGIISGLGATGVATKVAPRLIEAAKESPRAAAAVLGGGGMGLTGVLEGEGWEDRAKRGLIGATIGAPLGLGMDIAGDVAKTVWNYGTRAMGIGSGVKYANTVIADALKRAGLTADQVSAKLAQYKDRLLTAADVDELFQQIAKEVSSDTGVTRRQASKFLLDREANRTGRIGQDVDELIHAGDYYTGREAAMAAKKANAEPLYESALGVQPVITEDLYNLLTKSPSMRKAFELARSRHQDEFQKDLPELFVEVKPGIYELKTAPDARTLHRMKLALDDLIADNTTRNAITGVKTGQLNTDGRTYQGLKTKLLNWMDNNIVDDKGAKLYANARSTYAGDAAIIDAMDRGASLYKLHPNSIAAEFKKLDPSERDAFRVGVVKAIEDKMMNNAEGAAAVYKIFGKTSNSKEYAQIKAIFDNPADFETFKQRLLTEIDMAGTEKIAKTKLASSNATHVERPEFYPVTKRHFIPQYFLDAIAPSEKEKNLILDRVLTPYPQGAALLKEAERSAIQGPLSKVWEFTRPTRLLNQPLIPGSYTGAREPSVPEEQQPFALPTPQQNVLEVLKPQQYRP
jgi:hypothetical protein